MTKENSPTEYSLVDFKRLIARELHEKMKNERISKSAMAKSMKTSRTSLERLLDPDNTSVKLLALFRAAEALGKRLHIEIRDLPSTKPIDEPEASND